MSAAALAMEVLGWCDSIVEDLDELDVALARMDMDARMPHGEAMLEATARAAHIRQDLARLRAEARAVPEDPEEEEPAVAKQ
ncbi:MAG TPA: hypothetical protein VIY73_23215 [Polyangiaceae bacterium]